MEKIRIIHHSNQLGLGGTEKTMQLFCKYLDKSIFDVHALAPKFPFARRKAAINSIKALLGSKRARRKQFYYEQLLCRAPEFKEILGEKCLHLYSNNDLPAIVNAIRPQILHVHHSGEIDPPLDRAKADFHVPLIFTTNVFGLQGRPPQQETLSKILFVSHWLRESAVWAKDDPRCDVLYNPVEKPFIAADLRSELNIRKEVIVIGRIGRNADDIYDPISIRAYKKVETRDTLFLAISPPPRMKQDAQKSGITSIQYLEPSTDNVFLSKFYNTIDILAHARADGETFGCTIAEGMIHGRPVVTHRSDIRNAQVELVDPSCGFVAGQHDYVAYAGFLKHLIQDSFLREKMGTACRIKALKNYEAEGVTKKLESLYLAELEKAGHTEWQQI